MRKLLCKWQFVQSFVQFSGTILGMVVADSCYQIHCYLQEAKQTRAIHLQKLQGHRIDPQDPMLPL